MLTVYLNRTKAVNNKWIHDYKKYMDEYAVVKKTITAFPEDISQPYKLLAGAPKLVCVEGTYVEANRLTDLCNTNVKLLVNQWLIAVNNPESFKPQFTINFKWRR